jgi:hypothetical protein
MRRTRTDPKAELLVGVIVFMLAACGSTSSVSGSPSSSGSPLSGGSSSTNATATKSSVPKTDALDGTWQSDPISAADVDATVRPQFSGSAVDAWEGAHGCYPKAGQTIVATLHFDGGQLVQSSAVNGGYPQEEWTGSYVVRDSNTFGAVDQNNDHLYIRVDFKIRGDRLFTELIKDNLPDHTPWTDEQDGPGMSKLNGVLGKPLNDTMCQAAVYETTPFTRIG